MKNGLDLLDFLWEEDTDKLTKSESFGIKPVYAFSIGGNNPVQLLQSGLNLEVCRYLVRRCLA